MKLVLLRQCSNQKTADSRSPGNSAGVSSTLFHRRLLCAQWAHRLTVYSCWLATTSLVAFFLPSACHSFYCLPHTPNPIQEVIAKTIRQSDIDMNTHEAEFVTHIPPLWPCIPVNRFLKVCLLIGIFNTVQGQNLTGENTQRHPGVDEITRLYWDDLSIGFSNGFISFFRFFYSLDWPRCVCECVYSKLSVITFDIGNWLPSVCR